MAVQHFLTLKDIPSQDIHAIVKRASEIRQSPASNRPLVGKTLALLFDKSSTRTRVAFEVAMTRLGGSSLFLASGDSQLGRGETPEDSARVLARMVDVIAIRTFEHVMLERFASHSTVPVINALTDSFHPCQLLADMQTYIEHRGSISGKTVAWIGDGNNMCQSYINASEVFDFQLNIATPEEYQPDPELVQRHLHRVRICETPEQAAQNVDLIVTDVWASMGQEDEQRERLRMFKHYQVDGEILSRAASDALFMHCLPAHRGEEVSADVIDGAQSVIWDEAENRMHSQQALLEYLCLAGRNA